MIGVLILATGVLLLTCMCVIRDNTKNIFTIQAMEKAMLVPILIIITGFAIVVVRVFSV